MKRKTNLFNLNNTEDSLFLTFSNYTEYLTGNFLSTNTKMYPTSFLCFNLPFDNENTILDFKKYLMAYYENKLTALREYFVKNDKDPENYISPLFYLLDAIDNYFGDLDIVYTGDIVEQDYNGTYSDSICIINLNNGYKTNIIRKENIDDSINETTDRNIDDLQIKVIDSSINIEDIEDQEYIETENIEILFGWKPDQISSLFNNEEILPVYDDADNIKYYVGSMVKSLEFTSFKNNSNDENIEFNCIIPLFDIRNIKEGSIKENAEFTYEESTRSNIPLGIWISPEVIKVSKHSGHAQSWSLVIGSKFSALPYSSVNTIDDNNSFDESTVKDMIYLTYSELLANHAELQNKYTEALYNIQELNTKFDEIKAQVASLLFQSNLEKISEMIDNKFITLQNEFNSKMKLIEEYIANLKWKYVN